jgi:hypothetical protein
MYEVTVRSFLQFVAISLSILGAVAAQGCTSDNNDDSGNTTEVREIDPASVIIPYGQAVVVRFNFAFDEEDVFQSTQQVQVVVQLPRGLTFQTGSGEISGYTSTEGQGVTPDYVRCNDGIVYLVFNLNSGDLDNAAPPSSDTDAQLQTTIEGWALGNDFVIEARAVEGDYIWSCDSDFNPDQQQVMSVELVP